MHQRRRVWLATVVCALSLLVVPGGAVAAEGGGGLISVDWSLAVQIVNFLFLLLILYRFLYKPLLGKMEERTVAIKRSLDEAQAARAEAARQQEENATRLRAAYAEGGWTPERIAEFLPGAVGVDPMPMLERVEGMAAAAAAGRRPNA